MQPKMVAVWTGSYKCLGIEFHIVRPATEKARHRQGTQSVDIITSWWLTVECRCCLESVTVTAPL